jgi:hypothetical protein
MYWKMMDDEFVMRVHLGEVKKEEEEYVLPPHDLGEVKEEDEDVEKDDHYDAHQSIGTKRAILVLEEFL